jgi:hypothetical protein
MTAWFLHQEFKPPDRCRGCSSYWQDLKYCERLEKFLFDKNFKLRIKANGRCTNADIY